LIYLSSDEKKQKGEKKMIREIGSVFSYCGKTYKVEKGEECAKCAFYHENCVTSDLEEYTGRCFDAVVSVIFVEVEQK
jgi:hypothetical protein